jgi:hypothetical protein
MNMPNAAVWRWCLVLVLVALPGALTLAGRQAPPAPARPAPPPVRLAPADAAKRAEEARKNISVELAPGLEVTLWAPSGFVTDPVALDLDPEGRVYVTSTSRNNLPLDIRQHPYWFTSAHTLKTVEDLRAFYARELAPARSARNMWIPDLNSDGSHDLRDFSPKS